MISAAAITRGRMVLHYQARRPDTVSPYDMHKINDF